MYFWKTGKLACELKANTISMISKLVYLFIVILQYATGLLVFQAVPTVYRYIFTYAKEHVEARTGHPSLTVMVYNQTPEWFPWALGAITAFGLMLCFFAHFPGNLRTFIDRWVCLNTPLSVRILFVSLLFFCLAVMLGGFYFSNELFELQQAVSKNPISSNPFKFAWTLFTKVTGLKIVIRSLALLEGAQQIFKNINQFSYQAHSASYWIALVSTALYFWQLQKRMRCISSKA